MGQLQAGVKLVYSIQEDNHEILHHSYGIKFGQFENPHIVHRAITAGVVEPFSRALGNVELTAFHNTRTVNIDIAPYPGEHLKPQLHQDGIGTLIEYATLRHFANKIGKGYTVIHYSKGNRETQLVKTGRNKEMTVEDELAAMEKYLSRKGLLKNALRKRISRDDAYFSHD